LVRANIELSDKQTALDYQSPQSGGALNSKVIKAKRYIVRGAFLAALTFPFVATRMSPAGFSAQDARLNVEIDGVNYGAFDKIDGLQMTPTTDAAALNFRKITFKRDFVTDPSLYLWAKNVMHGRAELKDVQVVLATKDGEELSRYVLKFCQPLSWSVEAANPALGGFHEKIEMAVQDVAVY
jgi:hypothetical protein